jgi:hypothetical protein
LLLRHLQTATRPAVPSAGPGLWHTTLAVGRRWSGLAGWWRQPADPQPAVGLGERVDRTCRQLQADLRERGVRLVWHVSAASRDQRLSEEQSVRLLQSLEAAVRLLTEETAGTERGPAPASGPGVALDMPVRVDLDRLDGETGSHLRLRLSGGLRRTRPRCARRLRQLCTRLGAQLDIVEQAGLLQVEVVLRLSDEPA